MLGFALTDYQDTRRRPGLGGFWSDVLDMGEDFARKKLNDAVASRPQKLDITGHQLTDEQNRVGQNLATVLDRYEAGQATAANTAMDLRRIAADFEEFALQYGTRGRNGANDINALVRQLVADLPAAEVNGATGGGGGFRNIASSATFAGIPDWLLIGGVVIGGVMLYNASSRRRG